MSGSGADISARPISAKFAPSIITAIPGIDSEVTTAAVPLCAIRVPPITWAILAEEAAIYDPPLVINVAPCVPCKKNPAVPGIKNIAANSSNPVISFPNPLPEPAGTGVIITSSFATFRYNSGNSSIKSFPV